MVRTVPGRLTRTLRDIGVPFQLTSARTASGSWTDETIQSIDISHGGSDPAPGIEPSTCSLTVSGPIGLQSGETLSVILTNAAADVIAAHTGTVEASQIQDRYRGRIGRQSHDDRPKGSTSTFEAASWSAQLSKMRTTYTFRAGWTIAEALAFLCVHPALPEITFADAGPWDVLAEDILDATHSDSIGKLTSEIGVLVRHTRSGALQAWSLPYRRTLAQNRVATVWPLTRSQVLVPATWEQPYEDERHRVRVMWINADGTTRTRMHGGTDYSEIQELDWTHVRAQTDALEINWSAFNRRSEPREFTLPRLEIDLLSLLRSENAYHRGQAGQLLALNVGDTVNLAGDWPYLIDGVHIVTGIDEQITGSGWTITLSLAPYSYVFGDVSPDVPAMVWDSAPYPWDSETRSWDH